MSRRGESKAKILRQEKNNRVKTAGWDPYSVGCDAVEPNLEQCWIGRIYSFGYETSKKLCPTDKKGVGMSGGWW